MEAMFYELGDRVCWALFVENTGGRRREVQRDASADHERR